jgi:hypothetical protein
MVLNRDFSEFIALLNEKNVKYLIIGGYAVAYHGYPRYTKDLDIWVWLDPQNAVKVIDAIEAFGMGSLLLQAEDFLDKDNVVQLGMPPSRIDILTDLGPLDFEVCYANKEVVMIAELPVNFVDFDGLIAAKTIAGRAQDRVDIKKLKERKAKKK